LHQRIHAKQPEATELTSLVCEANSGYISEEELSDFQKCGFAAFNETFGCIFKSK
jgi:hypothetical protein